MFRRRRTRCRPAFSLVELLVAMALIVFIMSILSAAFAAGSKAFRDLKAAGDLAERLRGAIIILRSDLGAPHFDGRRKLSDPSFWRYGTGPTDFGPPPEGFLRIYQDVSSVLPDGSVAPPFAPLPLPNQRFDGLRPDQVTEFSTVRGALHFTVRLPGKGPGELHSTFLTNGNSQLVSGANFGGQEGREQRFQGADNPNVFRSQWAEVAWWMTPAVDQLGQPEFTKVDGPQGQVVAQPLYVLRRRQQLLFSGTGTGTQGNIEVPPTDVNDEVSIRPGVAPNVRVNKPADITLPAFRWNMERSNNTGPAADPAYAGWPTAFARQFPVIPAPPAIGPNIYPAELPAANPPGRIDDIVLNNVLSFDVRVLLQGETDFADLFDPRVQRFGVQPGPNNTFVPRNAAFRFDYNAVNPLLSNPQGPLVFDTWSRLNIDGLDYESNWFNLTGGASTNYAAIPLYQDLVQTSPTFGQLIRIRALMITIRIWDQKSLQSRQVTIVQDM